MNRAAFVKVIRPLQLPSSVALCIMLLTFSGVFVNYSYHGQVARQLDRIEQQDLKMITTKWMSGGEERSWTTTRSSGETIGELGDRHKAEVAEIKIIFPKDPDS